MLWWRIDRDHLREMRIPDSLKEELGMVERTNEKVLIELLREALSGLECKVRRNEYAWGKNPDGIDCECWSCQLVKKSCLEFRKMAQGRKADPGEPVYRS